MLDEIYESRHKNHRFVFDKVAPQIVEVEHEESDGDGDGDGDEELELQPDIFDQEFKKVLENVRQKILIFRKEGNSKFISKKTLPYICCMIENK